MRGIGKLKRNLLLLLTTIMLLSGWGVWASMVYLIGIEPFRAYPIIPISFYIVGIGFIEVLNRVDKSNARKLANIYLLLKTIKMFIFIIIALIYLFGLKVNMNVFAVVISFNYLLYIGFETYTFYRIEKLIKKNG